MERRWKLRRSEQSSQKQLTKVQAFMTEYLMKEEVLIREVVKAKEEAENYQKA